MIRRRGPKDNPNQEASPAREAALEAFLLEMEGLTPADIDRINAEHGAGPNPLPESPFRLDWGWGRRPLASAAPGDAPPLAFAHAPSRDDSPTSERRQRAQVFGDAMAEAGFANGQWVEVDLDAEPQDGDIVLAEVRGSAKVLRRLKIIGGARLLVASNPAVSAIAICDPAELAIHGVVKPPRGA